MDEVQLILTGLLLGFAAAISPGPLFALMVSETLKYGKKEGLAVAFSPLFTDIPIFLISYFLLYREAVSVFRFYEILYLFGGVLLLYLGYKNITYRFYHFEDVKTTKGFLSAFLKGYLLNIFNPYTYTFWFGVAINFFSNSLLKTSFFFVVFFISFLITEFFIILAVDRSKKFLSKNLYTIMLRLVGIIFVLIGINLVFMAVGKFF